MIANGSVHWHAYGAREALSLAVMDAALSLLIIRLLIERDDVDIRDFHRVGRCASILHCVLCQGWEVLWLSAKRLQIWRDANLLAQGSVCTFVQIKLKFPGLGFQETFTPLLPALQDVTTILCIHMQFLLINNSSQQRFEVSLTFVTISQLRFCSIFAYSRCSWLWSVHDNKL